MAHNRKSRLQEFVDWAAAHITGDEKRRSPRLFWERVRVRASDRLLQAFSQKGLLEVGGKAEFRIHKAKKDGGGTAFADYVWKPHVRSVEATEAAHCGVGDSGAVRHLPAKTSIAKMLIHIHMERRRS